LLIADNYETEAKTTQCNNKKQMPKTIPMAIKSNLICLKLIV
jgi:hypothetical protein